MIETINYTILQLIGIIEKINDDVYCKKSHYLFGASIGEHNRHIIELFNCLILNNKNNVIFYDKRNRDVELEQNKEKAIAELHKILGNIQYQDRALKIASLFNRQEQEVSSTYFRELMYNLEHSIHHMALIKVALLEFNITEIPKDFGFAPSTITFKNGIKATG